MEKIFTWTVGFRNDRMGFGRALNVEAVDYSQAVSFASELLTGHGYDPQNFAVISVVRGRQIDS